MLGSAEDVVCRWKFTKARNCRCFISTTTGRMAFSMERWCCFVILLPAMSSSASSSNVLPSTEDSQIIFERFWSTLVTTKPEKARRYSIVFLNGFSTENSTKISDVPSEWQNIVQQGHYPVTFIDLPHMGDWETLKNLRKLDRAIFVLWDLGMAMVTPWKDFAARLKQLRSFPALNYLIIASKSNNVTKPAKQEFAGDIGVVIFDPDRNGQPVISMGFHWVGLLAALMKETDSAADGHKNLFQMQTSPKLLNGATLKSSSATYCPFVCRDGEEVGGMEVNTFRSIGKAYNFTTIISEPEDGAWGALDNGTLTGMLGDVIYNKAEVAFAEFYVGVEQFNFLEPIVYMQDCNLVAVPLPNELDLNWSVLTVPLSWPVWVLFAIATLAYTLLYAGIGFDQYSFGEALFQNYYSIVEQDLYQKFKKNLLARLSILNWWIFTFIITTLYRAGLTAVLTVPAFTKPIDSIPELEASGLKFGMIFYGDTYYDNWFKSHSQESYRKLGEKVIYLESAVDGFKRVAEGDFAFSEPQWSSKFTIAKTFPGSQEKLPLHLMKGCVMQAQAGWFVPRHAFYTPHVKTGWHRLTSAGLTRKGIEDVIRQEAYKTHRGNQDKDADEKESSEDSSSTEGALKLKELATAFLVTVIGYAFACSCLLGEILWVAYKRRRETNSFKASNDFRK